MDPANSWSRRAEPWNSSGPDTYVEYTTRSQKVRKAESASQGNVARNRYKGMDHREHLTILGHGGTTGHQKTSPAAKKVACSNSCHHSERIPSAKAAGRCHQRTQRAPTSQQKIE